jgi:spermidine synthase
MHFLDKSVVFNTEDSYGTISVVDEPDDKRTLHFGDGSKQSQMLKSQPDRLLTPYEKVMSCWQLFIMQDASNVLVLGLGGGSATKHCLQVLPEAHISVVELRETVVNVAREYFALPNDDRLTVYLDDGAQFIAHQAQDADKQYDLLLVDMYDLENLYAYIYSEDFLSNCLKLLNVGGVVALNLWGSHQARFERVIAALGKVFHWKILVVPVVESSNVIVFAFHPESSKYTFESILTRISHLEKEFPMPWKTYLETILQNNREQLSLSITL